MRTYYAFRIKNEFVSLYRSNPSTLFHILRQIRDMQPKELNYGYTLLLQLIHPIEKENMDRNLFLKLHREHSYSKVGDVHCINQLYKDEVSTLSVHRVYLKIESNKDLSSFFAVLSRFGKNYFLCDFTNQDYFFLDDLKVLV